MFESITSGEINLHRLNFNRAPHPYAEIWGMYNELKRTELWDGERGQWNFCMNEGQEPIDSDRFADDQLLGILVDLNLNPAAAIRSYKNLKNTP